MRRTALTLALVMCLPACMKAGMSARHEGGAAASMASGAMPMAPASEGEEMAVAGDADEDTAASDGYVRDAQAGRLTAGMFDDARNPTVFAAFARHMQDTEIGFIAGPFTAPLTTVSVVDRAGHPIAGATVGVGRRTLVSGTDGRVVISGWDLGSRAAGSTEVRIQHGQTTRRVQVEIGSADTTVALPVDAPPPPTTLDVALILDATGSMGDELEYLKVELRSIAREIHRAFPNVDQRFALVVYRDEGDEYVTRHFDFTSDLTRFERQLGRQRADGGGDYPEAMGAALVEAGALSWTPRGSGSAARVAFVVADAPPHAERAAASLEAADELRTQGVAIYPVAASGVADEAEFVMRAAAVLSGGEYLFVTDDSGVGDAHAEPHIPCYAVETLRDAMTRVVRAELAGHRIEADPRRTIRRVGQAQDGVCTPSQLSVAR
jgi:hypothetical protein